MTQISFIYFIRLLRYSTGFYSVQYVFFYYVTLNRKNIMKKFGSGELKSQLSLNCCLKEGFPGGSDGKVSVCSAGDLGSIPGLGRSPGEGNGSPLQYSCLENLLDGGAW